ncbi:MAG: hypothetical protein Sapg2KO_39320 [Saprospiraceae bacterium]
MSTLQKIGLLFFILLILSSNLKAQDSLFNYAFIDYSANKIQNPAGLQTFFQKTKALENGQERQLRIAHLGDSHVQADFLSGQLRAQFQRQFGSAGRGLVFFYHQAGTHAPLDYKTTSVQSFESRRRIFQRGAPPIGVSGMSIAANLPEFSIFFHQKERFDLPETFDRVTLFHNAASEAYRFELKPGPGETIQSLPPISQDWILYTVRKGDTLFDIARQFGKTVAEIKEWNRLEKPLIFSGQQLLIQQMMPGPAQDGKVVFQQQSDWTSRAVLPVPIKSMELIGKRLTANKTTQLFGMLLEDTQESGVLYSMLGVNGATFYHFNHGENFFDQLPALGADLVLVTLGTNEAIQSKFDGPQFRKEVKDLLATIKEKLPATSILLTINPEVLVRKTRPSPFTPQVRKIIIEEARLAGAAWWDLYQIMGGAESIRDWRKADLAYVDFIHFTQKGYILQAELLYKAILEAYYASN